MWRYFDFRITLIILVVLVIVGCSEKAQVLVPQSKSSSFSDKLERDSLTAAMPYTSIRFDLPENAYVSLKIYNSRRRQVANLIDNEYFGQPGYYQVGFNASNLGSGTYYYHLVAGRTIRDREVSDIMYQSMKKMLLVK
ncbi:MAG: hypothetical protein EPO24_06215 [Bacteroidetes bacterium]|nr:MAG: hypothetical protein EPO24_06215 [Bacteroidota bacterium]